MNSLAVNACSVASDCHSAYGRNCCDGFCSERIYCDGKCKDVLDCTSRETCCFGVCLNEKYFICCKNDSQCDSGMRCNQETFRCEAKTEKGNDLAVGVGILGGLIFLCFVALRYYITCRKPRSQHRENVVDPPITDSGFLPPLPPYSPPSELTNENGDIFYTPRILQRNEGVAFQSHEGYARSRSCTYPPPVYTPVPSTCNGTFSFSDNNADTAYDTMLPPPIYTPQETPLQGDAFEDVSEPPPVYTPEGSPVEIDEVLDPG